MILTWTGGVAVVMVGLVAHSIITHLLDPLRSVPGPFLARFTRLWYVWDSYAGKPHETLDRLHAKHGPIVRFAPKSYNIADLDVFREIYGPRTRYEKSDWYQAHRSPEKPYTIATHQNNKEYAILRRRFGETYSFTNVARYEPALNKSLTTLNRRFNEFADAGMTVDLAMWFRYFALDAVCQITIGDMHFLENDKDTANLLSKTSYSTYYGNVIGRLPELHPWLWKIMPKDSSEKGALAWIKENLDAKKQPGYVPTTTTFVDVWLQQKDKMSEEDINLGVAASIGGGSETSAATIAFTIWLLAKHPSALIKVQAELDVAVEQHGLSDGAIMYEVAAKLEYLQAVIKESMRIIPVIAVQLPRVVPQGGDTHLGHFFREGLEIGVSLWPTRLMSKYFGEHAETFRPERYLGETEEAKRAEYYLMPFSIGPRNCIGRHIAAFELTKALALLLYTFDFQMMAPVDDLTFTTYSIAQPDRLLCKLKKRDHARLHTAKVEDS